MRQLNITARTRAQIFHEQRLRELLKHIAAQDQAALAALDTLVGRRVFAFALNKLNDCDDANTVVNDTLWQVWKQPDAFNGSSSVSTWVLGIARFKILETLRKRSRACGELNEDLESMEASSFDRLLQREEASLVHSAIAKLSPNHREVVVAHYFQDLSVDEIAVTQDCPRGTVQTRLYHARAELKRALSTLLDADCDSFAPAA